MQIQLIFHGSVILLAGLLCGAPMGRSINAGKTDDVVRGWRVAHSGLIIGALLLFCVALLLPIVTLSDLYDRLMAGTFVVSAYGFLIALPLGAAIRQRGLSSTRGAGQIVYVGNATGAIGSLIGGGMLMIATFVIAF